MRSPSERILDSERRSLSAIAAIAIGERAAFIVQEINHWTKQYKDKRDKEHFHQGFYWIWNSYKQWRKAFPFIPEPSLKKVILDLERKNILVSAEFNRNRGDRTKWYRVNYGVLDKLIIEAEAEYERIMSDPSDLIDPMVGCERSDEGCERSDEGCERSDEGCERSTLSTDLSIDLSIDQTTNKNKEADFVFSEIRDLKDSTDNAKIQDPIPPTPLSHSPAEPEKIVKPLPPDPMGDRFRAKKSKITSWWTRLLADKAHTEWLEIIEPWADTHGVNADLEPHFKESLITATIQHLKTFPKLKHDLSAANTCLENYIRNDKVTDFKNRAKEAIAIEEAERRLEERQITKPECTTTYWYLWEPVGRSKENEIMWDCIPQIEDASEKERNDRQAAAVEKALGQLQAKGLIHLAIANKHKLSPKSKASKLAFSDVIGDYGTYLRNKAQQLQGAIAA